MPLNTIMTVPSLGDETQTTPALTALTQDLDKEDSPYCIFIFRYRPRGIVAHSICEALLTPVEDLLQAQGIVPYYQPSAIAGTSRPVQPAARSGSGHIPKGTKRAHESNTSTFYDFISAVAGCWIFLGSYKDLPVKKEVQDEHHHVKREHADAHSSLAVGTHRSASASDPPYGTVDSRGTDRGPARSSQSSDGSTKR